MMFFGKVVAPVKLDQIVAMDARQMLVFDLPAVGVVAAVEDARQLAAGDRAGVVVAARDAAAILRDRQIDLVLAELRIASARP